MERVAHIAKTFAEADEWNQKQLREMSLEERMRAAKELKARLYPGKQPDIREWHRTRKER